MGKFELLWRSARRLVRLWQLRAPQVIIDHEKRLLRRRLLALVGIGE